MPNSMAALPYFVSRVSAFAAIRASPNRSRVRLDQLAKPRGLLHDAPISRDARDRAPLPEGHMQVRRLQQSYTNSQWARCKATKKCQPGQQELPADATRDNAGASRIAGLQPRHVACSG